MAAIYPDRLKQSFPIHIQEEFGALFDDIDVIRSHDNAIGHAALDFVAIKYELDAGRETILRQILGDSISSGKIDPHCYAYAILPFFQKVVGSRRGGEYKAFVFPNIVVGESWNWTPAFKTEEQKESIVHASFEGIVAERNQSTAKYSYIRELNIVLACEGKNRVALFREQGLPIPALVEDIDYPAASRIRLFNLPEGCFAVLDDRYVQRMKCLEVTCAVLEPYGTSVENDWPETYPTLSRVLPVFSQFCVHRGRDDIDMKPIKYRQQADEKKVKVSLLDFDNPLKLSPLNYVLLLSLCFLLFFSGMSFEGLTILRTIFITLSFVGLGLLTLMAMPLFECEVQKLDETLYQRTWMELTEEFRREENDKTVANYLSHLDST